MLGGTQSAVDVRGIHIQGIRGRKRYGGPPPRWLTLFEVLVHNMRDRAEREQDGHALASQSASASAADILGQLPPIDCDGILFVRLNTNGSSMRQRVQKSALMTIQPSCSPGACRERAQTHGASERLMSSRRGPPPRP